MKPVFSASWKSEVAAPWTVLRRQLLGAEESGRALHEAHIPESGYVAPGLVAVGLFFGRGHNRIPGAFRLCCEFRSDLGYRDG